MNKNQLLTSCTRIDNENQNSTKQGTKRKGLRRDQNPGGHKEGRASFPDQFTYKVFTNPWLKSLTLERRREGQRGEGGARLRERRAACCPGQKSEREGEGVFNPNNSQPKILNYP